MNVNMPSGITSIIQERDNVNLEKFKMAYVRSTKIIEAEYIAMNHQDNTDYEKGYINGLITACNILKKHLGEPKIQEDNQ
jgi:hypothetical protein